jgi:SAM-dependent methyltransferase
MADESKRIIGLYEQHARAWDAKRGSPRALMEKDWLDRFAAMVPAGGAVLDIGCGSGKPIAAYLVAQGFAVTGIDSSPSMIDMCRDRFPAQRWLVADMRALALGEIFQGLIAWGSFFHLSFDDQRKMFPVFRDHAAPGAPLLFTSGPAHGESIGSFEGEPLYHASLDSAEYRALLGANKFEVVDFVPEDPTCGRHSIWLARRKQDR